MTSKITTIVIIVFFAWQAYSERKVKKHEKSGHLSIFKGDGIAIICYSYDNFNKYPK